MPQENNQPFIAGVPPEGLQDVHEVRILICYLLSFVDTPLTREQLNEIFQENHLMNYFTFAEAMSALIDSKHIEIKNRDGSEYCYLSPIGEEAAKLLRHSLPRAVRDRVVSSALSMLSRIKNEQENEVSILPYKNGFQIRLSIHDTELDLLELTLFVPDEMQAQIVKDNFLKNPADFYANVITFLTNNKTE